MTARAALLLAVGVLAGCDSSTRNIFGSISTTYQTPHGSTDVPLDFTTTTVQALFAGPSGTDYQAYVALGATDGTFEIRDVPVGDYVLQIGSSYYVTDVDTFTLHTPAFGHPNAIPDKSGAALAVTAGNLAPWSSNPSGIPDQLEAYSGDADARNYGYDPTNIQVGDTALTDLVFRNDGSNPLLEGDDFAVAQLQSESQNDVEYQNLVRLYAIGPVTQTANAVTTVGDEQAMFVDETATYVMLTQSLMSQAFATETGYDGTHFTLVNPTAAPFVAACDSSQLLFSIGGQPGDGSLGLVGAGADYLWLDGQLIENEIDLSGIPYPVPVVEGETWTPYFAVTLQVCVPIGTGGLAVPITALATVGPVDKIPTTIAPGTGVVRKPVIASAGTNIAAGLDMFQPQDYVGTVPTIAWLPPDVGAPTTYAIQIFQVTSDGVT